MKPRFMTVTPARTNKNAITKTLSCWSKMDSQLPAPLCPERLVKAGLTDCSGGIVWDIALRRESRSRIGCCLDRKVESARSRFDRRGRIAIHLLPDRRRQDVFLGRVAARELGDKVSLAHDADSVAQTQDLRQVAGNHQDRHVFL